MSTLALMRWLESAPGRYDAGMRLLTLGRVTILHAETAEFAVDRAGDRVLEIGCGTGSVTTRLLDRKARVTAVDQSPEMLEQAKERLGERAADVRWLEQTASEIDRLPAEAFDAVVLCLCLSDMSASERAFVLREAATRLASGGRLVAADEVRAPQGWRRALQSAWRIPQSALGWLLVGSVSRPIANLRGEIEAAGFRIRSQQGCLCGTLALIVAEVVR
jgi:demethylmenaquinone methyltransferase/2-methoxy-6-polyprenyl-1,4-benzoquinol methylase